MYSMSIHATQRSQQRSIPMTIVELILALGTESKQPGKAVKLELDRRNTNQIIKGLKDAIRLVEKAQKKAVLTSETGAKVITVMNSKH